MVSLGLGLVGGEENNISYHDQGLVFLVELMVNNLGYGNDFSKISTHYLHNCIDRYVCVKNHGWNLTFLVSQRKSNLFSSVTQGQKLMEIICSQGWLT